MAYSALADMAKSGSLQERLAACAALESVPGDPNQWVQAHLWELISVNDWVDAWGYATDNLTVNSNPDTGARVDVINDNMILTRVQAVKALP